MGKSAREIIAESAHSTFFGPAQPDVETARMLPPRVFRHRLKHRMVNAAKLKRIREFLPAPPATNEAVHVLTGGLYDFHTHLPLILQWTPRADEFYASTWSLSRDAMGEVWELWDAGRIVKFALLVDRSLKRRHAGTYGFALRGIRARGGRMKALRNHAKIMLLRSTDPELHIVIETSANLTTNPRLENYTLYNNAALYEFHRQWMEDALKL